MKRARPFIFTVVLIMLASSLVSAAGVLKVKPVPQIKPVKLGKLSPAYDWINNERIRAMYGYIGQWKEQDLLDHITESGFNTIIVHAMSYATSEDGWPQEAAAWARVQQERKLHVLVSWPYGTDDRYSNTQFGAYHTGTAEVWKNGPCPLSAEYWNRVIGDRAVVAAKAGLTGMVVDMEMYGADHTRYPGPCYCDRCWSRFVDEYIGDDTLKKIEAAKRADWVSANGIWEAYPRWQEIEVASMLQAIRKRVHAVNPHFILGNLLDPESLPGLARGFGTSTMPALIFSELEYHGNVGGVPLRLQQLKKQGYPALYVPGFWVQPVTPPHMATVISQAAAPSAGYWIWSTAAFTPGAGGEYAHAKEFTDDEYWDAFRSTNALLNTALAFGGTHTPMTPNIPTARVPRVKRAPVTDADWEKGALIGPFVSLNTGNPAEVNTVARLLWDGTRLHIKVMCEEPAPDKMAAPSGERDNGNLWAQESIEIFWTRLNGDRMAHVIVNNAGTIADSLMLGLRPESPGWNPHIVASASNTDNGWELVLSIPVHEDGGKKIVSGGQLRMEIGRNRSQEGTTCWAPTKGMYKAAPHLWGMLTLE